MSIYDGAAVRALVDKLPPHVFDDLVADLPELFDSLRYEQIEYFHWEETGEGYTEDDVADAWGYGSIDEMSEELFVYIYPDGVLIVE